MASLHVLPNIEHRKGRRIAFEVSSSLSFHRERPRFAATNPLKIGCRRPGSSLFSLKGHIEVK